MFCSWQRINIILLQTGLQLLLLSILSPGPLVHFACVSQELAHFITAKCLGPEKSQGLTDSVIGQC